MIPPAVLLLADSRLPSGGHAHSGGVEMAVTAGLVSTVDDLAVFLRGRVRTAGLTSAAFAAAACQLAQHAAPHWKPWDEAFSARIPTPSLRIASRAQGGALLRTVSRMWRTPALRALAELGRPHQPLVLGAATDAGGGQPADAAALAVHHLIGGACSAAVRLLGLDPLDVAATQAAIAPLANQVATEAAVIAGNAVTANDPTLLPAVGGPLPELLAARHARMEVTLFAS
ncbi:MAG TPA: urease accessory UreF family protein [Pseudonocardiaceae bacterium]|nr:urease accessory UreF family protein [Pseudonocardiaceae bacterium]